MRPTVKNLICEGLGYCCEYAFFSLYRRTDVIADRLGVETRTIRYHKVAFKAGEMRCEGKEKCLKARGALKK